MVHGPVECPCFIHSTCLDHPSCRKEADEEVDKLVESHHNFLLEECNRLRAKYPHAAEEMSLGKWLLRPAEHVVVPFIR